MNDLNQLLTPVRQQIDKIDLQLITLLNTRASLAKQSAIIKQQFEATPYQPEREQQVLKKLQQINSGPLPDTSIIAIWREIMSACRALEESITVAYLGPSGTFSEAAALHHFGQAIIKKPCITIDEVFRSVETGEAKYGVVPVENSSEGPVSRTLDMLLQSALYINAELSIPIYHHLLSNNNSNNINVIRAHPQALAQCQHWLNSHYPHIERQAVSSTAEAARLASNDQYSAAIASESAAQKYALPIVHRYIQDDQNNRTRFFVISKTEIKNDISNETSAQLGEHVQIKTDGTQRARYQTSLILSLPNQAGAIYRLVTPLAEHDVSMCRIESRPARTGTWEYYFYIDIEGHQQETKVAQALKILQQQAAFYKCLGSYPRSQY